MQGIIRLSEDVRVGFLPRPVWSDERTVVYSPGQPATQEIVGRPADGSAGAVVLTTGAQPTIARGRLVFHRRVENRGN